ncbi:hypothetical protein [Arenimonas oryziterrae]|uniref:hypothetical protein n=1 Tax=Arenimonas oryziterrae TaxID=498055 RepID=UPI000413AD54|nr:hypothetical protein [Arenimonas oryziterrae]
MNREADQAQELFGEILGAICRDTGLREELAMPYAEAAFAFLQSVHGGQRLYIPAADRKHLIDKIVSHYNRHGDASKTCAEFGISRRKLYYLLKAAPKNAQNQN